MIELAVVSKKAYKVELFKKDKIEIIIKDLKFTIISRITGINNYESIVSIDNGFWSVDTILWEGNNLHNELCIEDDYYDLKIVIENGRPQLYISYIE